MQLMLDCHSGVSGERLLAALIGAGADARKLHALVNRLDLRGVRVATEVESYAGNRRATVSIDYAGGDPLSFTELTDRVEKAWLPDPVQKMAGDALYSLCKAESRWSGAQTIAEFRLAAPLAVEALLTITGGIILWASLNCPRITTKGPVVIGGSARRSIRELLATVPHSDGPVNSELTTPAAAALLNLLWREPVESPVLLVGEVTIPYGVGDDAIRGEMQAFLFEQDERTEIAEAVLSAEGDRLL